MLLTSEDNGYLYIYGFDTAEGGDCHLIRQFHLTSTDHCGSSGPSSQPPTRKTTSESSTSGSATDQLHPEESVTKSSEGEEELQVNKGEG